MLTNEQAKFVSGYQTVRSAPVTAVEVRPSKHISAAARDHVGIGGLRGQQLDVFEVVVAAHRNGVADLSGREIQARYRMLHPGKDIDTGTISARVNSLIASKLLERCPERPCSITGVVVGPVRPVAQQARLVG